MCGIEILLCCCAAGGAAGCCAKHRFDKSGKKKKGEVVKGRAETYKRHSSTMGSSQSKDKASSTGASKSKKGVKQPSGQPSSKPRHRPSAFEEYQQKYGGTAAAQTKQPEKHSKSEKHKKTVEPGSPKAGKMDAEEFGRLKQVQQREKLNKLM